MSIVELRKITFYGHTADRHQVLEDLQEIGVLHLIPLTDEDEKLTRNVPVSRSREALRFILSCPHQRRQVLDPEKFDAADVEQQILSLKDAIQDREDERDFLAGRIEDLKPWGDFHYPALDDMGNLRLWFYVVPHRDMAAVENCELVWTIVRKDNRFNYIVVVSNEEPEDMPVPRVHTGDKPLSELQRRLDEVELELEDLQAGRAALTRWCTLFESNINRLEDRDAVRDAIGRTHDEGPVFALQAWAPAENIPPLEQYGRDKGLATMVQEPAPDETPPTLMRNPNTLAGGQDLVSFYTTPRYWLWDPSIIVYFSFAVFFAMIMADAGYSLILAGIVAAYWERMGTTDGGQRFRILMGVLAGAGVLYGVMVGSYFGLSFPAGTLPARLKVLDPADFEVMMQLAILIGVFHLILANGFTAWHFRGTGKALAPGAWILILLGGTVLWQSVSHPQLGWLQPLGIAGLAAGFLGVLFFTGLEGPWWKRLLNGLSGLTNLSNAFGDALSYLRLFALGLASASLAATFNEMAGKVHAYLPGIGVLFAILILFLGHTMNFVLAVSGGFIHGLRLNFIEFFRWSIPEEGRPFKAFARKEKKTWKE